MAANNRRKQTPMITVKVQCECGQRYAFDVEPVRGRMPSSVACPICGVDGTPAANQIIAQTLPPPPAPAIAPLPSMKIARAADPAESAPAPAPVAQRSPLQQLASLKSVSDGEAEKWKWWYFVLAGICIGGYSIWQAYDQHRLKPLGELFFAVFCIAIGIWDFQHKRSKKQKEQ